MDMGAGQDATCTNFGRGSRLTRGLAENGISESACIFGEAPHMRVSVYCTRKGSTRYGKVLIGCTAYSIHASVETEKGLFDA